MPRVVGYASPDARTAAAAEVGAHVRAGGLVVYPTETVYGIGCALVPAALDRLVQWKRGPADGRPAKPFLLLVGGPGDVPGLTWTRDARILADRFWPGPLTLALPADPAVVPSEVVGPEGTVALRVSPHPAVAALIEAAGGPVTSSSANRPGGTPASTVAAAAEAVADLADVLVLDGGALPDASPSTIVRCDEVNTLIREGSVPRHELAEVVELK